MTAPTVNVTVNLSTLAGVASVGVTVRANLDVNEVYHGFVIADDTTGVSNASGIAVLACFPNAPSPTGLGTQGSTYRFKATIPGGRKLDVLARVPNANCNLHDILVNTEVVALDAAELAILQAQSYAAAADVSALAAEADALQTALDRIQTGLDRVQTGLDRTAIAGAAALVAYIYPSTYTVAPTTRPDGSARQSGDQYFNSVANLTYRWNGATWVASDINTANLAASTGSSLIGHINTGTGATARTVQDKLRDDPTDLKDFGAVCNGVTDDYAALLSAFNSGAKRIRIPATFYSGSTLYVDRHVIFEGDGAGRQSSSMNSIWKFPTGKTAVVVERGSTTYGDDSEFAGISFEAASKNATATTGAIAALSKSLTLAAAQDFATGQLVLVRGAGESHLLAPSWYLTAATTAASPTVALNVSYVIPPGTVLSVAGANFPAGAYVLSQAGTSLTMSQNAGNTVAAGAVTRFHDLIALVMSGGGTVNLTLNEGATTSVAAAKVEHYDCGIYSQSRIKVWNCRGTLLSGAAIYLHSGSGIDSRSGQTTNANNWLLRDINGDNCRHVIRTRGSDANAGSAYDCAGISSVTEHCFVDNSQLGNNYVGCHVSGGYGYLASGTGNFSTYFNCYREGGTYNSFGANVLVVGGNMGGVGGSAEGGNCVLGSSTALITGPIKAFSSVWQGATMLFGQNETTNNPLQVIDASPLGGNSSIPFRRSVAGDGGVGLWGWFPGNAHQAAAMLFPDSGHPDGSSSGAYFRNGINLSDGASNLAAGNFTKQLVGGAAPAAGTWRRGDIIWNAGSTSGGFVGWVCTAAGTPGTWKTFGAIS